MKKITTFFVTLILVLSMNSTVFAEITSASQIVAEGGSTTEDGVTLSKTIEGTDIENVFDITLKVETTTDIQTISKDPDMAVVIVMDISNSMRDSMRGVVARANTYNGTSNANQYEAALVAADNFVDLYQAATANSRTSQIGFVAFNSNSYLMAPMQEVKTTSAAESFKSTYTTALDRKIYDPLYNANNYSSVAKSRFTNIEAGLKRGFDIIKNLPNQNKFIVFLSDGFPTTYIKRNSGYDGCDTYTEGASSYTEGVFYDEKYNIPCSYGTSYSERAAVKAREQAVTIKNAGVDIFSIGVQVGGQTIKRFDVNAGNNFSVIDRPNTSNYEIGSYDNVAGFKNWLKGTALTGIGSGYYYDSTNQSGMNDAFTSIFNEMQRKTQERSAKAWQVTDPMGTNLEFIGFYDKNDALQSTGTNLVGSSGGGKENTATYTSSDKSFNWNLQQSGYSFLNGTYTYILKYRVRLTNEVASGFVENNSYSTNGITTLTYQIITTSNGNSVISEMKTLDAKIPAVKGYLAGFEFTKKDQYGRILKGAEFTLEHDTDYCKICKGNNTSVDIPDQTATSGDDGKVSFNNIPSGHKYTLTETKVPENNTTDGSTFEVIVSYDTLTVTAKKDGNSTTWENDDDHVVINSAITFNVSIKKVDGASQIPLSGAEFMLYTDDGLTKEATHPDGKKVGVIKTGDSGLASLGILDIGTYYLSETKAPNGYYIIAEPIKIKVDKTGVTYEQKDYSKSQTGKGVIEVKDDNGIVIEYILTVANTSGIELPNTGGSGTLPYTLGGLTLISTALMYGFVSRRRRERRSR